MGPRIVGLDEGAQPAQHLHLEGRSAAPGHRVVAAVELADPADDAWFVARAQDDGRGNIGKGHVPACTAPPRAILNAVPAPGVMAFKTDPVRVCRTGRPRLACREIRHPAPVVTPSSGATTRWPAPSGCAATFSDFSYAPHAHDADCLAVITRGALRIRAGGREFIARSGDMFAANADVLHAGWPIDDAGTGGPAGGRARVRRRGRLAAARRSATPRWPLASPIRRTSHASSAARWGSRRARISAPTAGASRGGGSSSACHAPPPRRRCWRRAGRGCTACRGRHRRRARAPWSGRSSASSGCRDRRP